MKRKNKGISPLIAAVLLIAFTMTIAAILATWAQTFGRGKLGKAEKKATKVTKCGKLAIRIGSMTYSPEKNKTQAVVWNEGPTLTNFTVLIYKDTVPISKTPTTQETNDEITSLKKGDFAVFVVKNVSKMPRKVEILSMRGMCPKVQPLATCEKSGGEFVC